MIAQTLAGASRRLARALPFRPSRLALSEPVVSFTFDDFPLSAAVNAAPVLEQFGARGTFYFADGLAGGCENQQLIAQSGCAADLAARGHDIGGHTRGHLNVQRTAPDKLIADVAANETAIAALSGRAPTSFAYPFGVVSLLSKHLLAGRYGALRGIQPGINRGWVDMAHLHAQELYDHTLPLAAVDALFDDLVQRGGWLIFYTHDVREMPSSIGCSPQHFAAVLRLAHDRGLAIQSVKQVLDRLRINGRIRP